MRSPEIKSYEINMTVGRLMPKLWAFVIPLMLSSLLQIAFNAADLIVVGRFGSEHAMSAVGSNSPLVSLMVNLLNGVALGAGVVAARHFGAGENDRVRDTASTALIVGVCSGVIFGIAGIVLAVPLLRLVGSPDEVASLAKVYLRVYFAGLPVIALYNFAGAVLRSTGNTRQPLIYLAVAGVINVILNLFFVIVLKLDVMGVALATVISQCVSCFLTVRCLLRSRGLTLRELRFRAGVFRRIMAVGLPAGVQGTMFSISNFIIQAAINSLGTAAIAGSAACLSLETFVWCPQDAVQQAATTAISQNVGARQEKRAMQAMGICHFIVILISVVFSAVILLLRRQLLWLYTGDEAAVEQGLIRIWIIFTTYSLGGIMTIMSGVNRGLGFSTLSMVVTLLGVCVSRVIWIYTIFAAHPTPFVLFIIYPISWALTSAAHYICFFIVRKKAFPPNAAPARTA